MDSIYYSSMQLKKEKVKENLINLIKIILLGNSGSLSKSPLLPLLGTAINTSLLKYIFTYIFKKKKILLLSKDRSRFRSWQSCSRAFAQKESKGNSLRLWLGQDLGLVCLHKTNNFTRFESSSSIRLINCSQFLMQMNLQIHKCQLTAEMQTW